MAQASEKKGCLVCHVGNREIPLIPLDYADARMWVCTRHLPMLIHSPEQLAEKFPWAANLTSAGGEE